MATGEATELQCEQTIIHAAKVLGWKVHGTRTAFTRGRHTTPIKGHVGFPDLVLCRPPHLWLVELKRKPNRPEPAQLEWLNALDGCPGVQAFVLWVPQHLDEFCRFLAYPTELTIRERP